MKIHSRPSGLSLLIGVIGVILASGTIGVAQKDILVNPRDNQPIRPPTAEPNIPRLPNMGAPAVVTSRTAIPPSSVVETANPFDRLTQSVSLLRQIDAQLMSSTSSAKPDYEMIASDASDAARLSIRMMRDLSLPGLDPQVLANTSSSKSASPEQLNASIVALNSAIDAFLINPIVTDNRTIEAESLGNAGSDLLKIVERSTIVRGYAEQLLDTAGAKSGKSHRVKSRLTANLMTSLNLGCSAWSVSEFLNRPSQPRGEGSVDLNGIQAKTRRFRLAEELTLPAAECVDSEAYETALSSKVEHVAIVRDFTAYAVKGKIFAYQVFYEMAVRKDGRVTTRFGTISFYYVDDTGTGNFELFRGSLALGFPPDWIKEMAGKPFEYHSSN